MASGASSSRRGRASGAPRAPTGASACARCCRSSHAPAGMRSTWRRRTRSAGRRGRFATCASTTTGPRARGNAACGRPGRRRGACRTSSATGRATSSSAPCSAPAATRLRSGSPQATRLPPSAVSPAANDRASSTGCAASRGYARSPAVRRKREATRTTVPCSGPHGPGVASVHAPSAARMKSTNVTWTNEKAS